MSRGKRKTPADRSSWTRIDPQAAREREKYENPIPSRELILQQLSGERGPLTQTELEDVLGVTAEADREALRRRLAAMVRDGELVQNRREAFGPIERMNLVRGTVIGHRDGFGFLKPDDGGDDLFLSPRQMRSLLHGDRAVARVTGTDRRGRREGALVRILERNTQSVVGRYQRESGVGFVIPDNTRIAQDVLIPNGEEGSAVEGQIVTAEITQQPGKRNQPIGHIREVLGDHMAPGMEIDVAIRAHNLPFEWPPEVEQQMLTFGKTVPGKHKQGREDLRALPLITIDGEDARDFDDAVYCESTRSGWKLWVAIADVSAYVAPDSPLDREAVQRATSVYFPQRVLPMLPEVLSNGLCSLNPEVDRLCMVCEMRVNREGKVTRSRFYAGVMRSHARMTYTEVASILEDDRNAKALGREALVPRIRALHGVFGALLKARRQRGAIDFDTTETRIIFGPERKIEDIVPVERTDAHRLIEECMVAANVEAARFLARHRMPMLYRVHAGPTADRLEDLRAFLAERGLGLGGGQSPEPRHYAQLIDELGGRADTRLVQTVLLRSLPQAVYSPDNQGHFGLALDFYGHFTSPIRRYPDLLVHRAIRHVLAGGKPADFEYDGAAMENLGAHCSSCERRADEATRDAVDWLKSEFMLDKVGEEFDGLVTGVTSFGLFIELDGVYTEGLVHVTSLSNDYYHFEPKYFRLRGERTGRTYRLADRMRVRVVRVDLDQRKIDFEPVEPEGAQSPRRTAPGKSPKRKRAPKQG